MFETFSSPAFFSVKRSVMSLFATGKTTGFVYSSGAEQTELMPICDGYILRRGFKSFNQGGNTVTRAVLNFMESNPTNPVHPHFDYEFSMTSVNDKKEATLAPLNNITDSMRKHYKLKLAKEAKEEFVRVLTDREEK